MLAVVLTILKSPLVMFSFVLRFVYESLCRWLVLVHSSWRPWCSQCATSQAVQVGSEAQTIQDLLMQGYSATDLKDLGVSLVDLYAAGFTIKELHNAGFQAREFGKAGLCVEHWWHECGGHLWWRWFPLVFLTWLSSLACLLCMVVVLILVACVGKLILAVIWPAYIAAGWLRVLAQARRRASARQCCEPWVQGLTAGYQVVWAGSVLTNICILNRGMNTKWSMVQQTCDEVWEYAKGDRQELSPSLSSLSLFPPILVGLFADSWDLHLRTLAQRLGVSKDKVEEAWRGLARQMIRLGRAAVETGLLTAEWVDEVPAELCIGLPALALLDAVERSPPGELLLVGGLRITPKALPKLAVLRGSFGNSSARRKLHGMLQGMPPALILQHTSCCAQLFWLAAGTQRIFQKVYQKQ